LLKRDIRASKRTIRRSLRQARSPRPTGQAWAMSLRNHADAIWAGDFLPVTDLLFRPLYAFFVVALGTRRVVHVGVTRHPTDAWVAQQLREATPFGQRPRYLIRDNDGSTGHVSTDWPRRAASASCARPIAPHGPTPRASASWGACGANALIIC